jgi:hypothetical protein
MVHVLLRYSEAIERVTKFLNIRFIAVFMEVPLDLMLRQWTVI